VTYRVIQWSTGNVGTAALRCIIGHPELELVGVPGSRLVAPELPLKVPAGEQAVANLFIVAPSSSIRGQRAIQLKVQLTHEAPQLLTYTLLGPEQSNTP